LENKVGDNIPPHEKFLALLQQLQATIKELQAFGITLDDFDRRRLLHPRVGAEPHIKTVLGLAEKYRVNIPSAPLLGVENDVRLATELAPLDGALHSALQLVADTEAQAQSEYWQGFLAYYGALAAMAVNIPELAVELQPVIDFMATGKRRAVAQTAPKP
jgi:hypothetical protein